MLGFIHPGIYNANDGLPVLYKYHADKSTWSAQPYPHYYYYYMLQPLGWVTKRLPQQNQ